MENGDIARYFKEQPVNIPHNRRLREPQLQGYLAALQHFRESDEHALIVLPVGCGKTGLMAMLPFRLAQGRVLIVAPNLAIREVIERNLDPSRPNDNFYLRLGLLRAARQCPQMVMLGEEELTLAETNRAHIVVTNIQQLTPRRLAQFPPDYFRFIIFDEGHHNVAASWRQVMDRFPRARFVSVTGTPFRSDDRRLEGKEIFRYALKRAMDMGYTKKMVFRQAQPAELYFTYEGRDRRLTLEEVLEMRENDWFSQGVGLSDPCCRTIVEASVREWETKKRLSRLPHKIIAAAMSINHARRLQAMYEARNLKTYLVHSEMPEKECRQRLIEFERDGDCIVQVGKLGEGYDHHYLSIAAIFRPYRSLSAFIQFVGRALRIIPDAANPEVDNLAVLVSHVGLNQQKNWNDLQDFATIDRAFFGELLTGEVEEGVGRGQEGGRPRPERPRMEVLAEFGISFDEEGLAPEFLETYQRTKRRMVQEVIGTTVEDYNLDLQDLLELFGPEMVMEKQGVGEEAERVIRPDKAKMEARRLLNEDCKRVAYRVLRSFNLDYEGNELVRELGEKGERNNFEVVIRLVNRRVNERMNLESGQRGRATTEDYERVRRELGRVEEEVVVLIEESLPEPEESWD